MAYILLRSADHLTIDNFISATSTASCEPSMCTQRLFHCASNPLLPVNTYVNRARCFGSSILSLGPDEDVTHNARKRSVIRTRPYHVCRVIHRSLVVPCTDCPRGLCNSHYTCLHFFILSGLTFTNIFYKPVAPVGSVD